jgi:NADPH:quinone reductase-like Zn-dependent oxidoreductase
VRAVVQDRYGSPDVLRIQDVPVPSPAAGQVRVKVAATALNLSDWEGLTGSPGYARLGGLRAPRRRTLGSDIAGWVDDVGEGVTRFRPGDEVYGDNLQLKGGFAEYTVAPESALALKPAQLTFVQASTIPQAGAIALQGTRDAAAGRRMLINGAGGGSGSFAIQLAKQLGAHVTGVDNARKLDFMRSLGADEVIDYRTDDFTRRGPYDEILDLVAHRSVFAYRRALAAGGRYRCVGGTVRSLLRVLTVGRPTSGRWPHGAQPARSTSTSTAHSAWTRSPGRWPMSAKAEPAARWLSRSRESSRGPGAPHQWTAFQAARAAAGSSTVTRIPPAGRAVRVSAPSCAWVMLLTIARPRPTPAWSVRMRSVPR